VRRILYYVIGTGLVFYGWQHYRQARFAAESEATAETAPAADPASLALERPDGAGGIPCEKQWCGRH